MMDTTHNKKYFIISLIFHVAVVLVLVLGFEFSSPLIVAENTDKHDVISAVILGDTAKSKIITQHQPPPTPPVVKPEPKPEPKPELKPEPKPEPVKKDVIALKKPEKKKPADLFGKDLLADLDKLKKESEKKKKLKQKELQAHFEKTLKQQAEKSMRQQLLNEDIKLNGTQSRQSQGIVNKYQALIQQAISEHWIIPPGSNKKLYSMLLIRLAPGGRVIDVQVTRSSGDPALDSSARAAVMKASPLPVPSEPGEFEAFRQFNLKAKPENVMDDAPRIY